MCVQASRQLQLLTRLVSSIGNHGHQTLELDAAANISIFSPIDGGCFCVGHKSLYMYIKEAHSRQINL